MKSLSRVQPCDPVDCSPAGSSVHESLQARILEWVAISFSRGSSQPRDRTRSPALQADALSSEPNYLNFFTFYICFISIKMYLKTKKLDSFGPIIEMKKLSFGHEKAKHILTAGN